MASPGRVIGQWDGQDSNLRVLVTSELKELSPSHRVAGENSARVCQLPTPKGLACRWTPALRAPAGQPHASSFLKAGFLRRLSARESERRVPRPRLRGWLTDSPSIRGLLPLMDVYFSSSRSQLKLTRLLSTLNRVGFRAVAAVNARLFHRPAVSPARLERASPPLQGRIVAARPQGENVAARIRTSEGPTPAGLSRFSLTT